MNNTTKNEIELAKIHKGMRTTSSVCDIIKSLLKYGTVCFFIWCLFTTIHEMLFSKPETLKALCGVLKEFKVTNIILAGASLLAGGGWCVEKGRTKKLVQKNGELRHRLEHSDKFNERSGLDENGDAQEDKEV